MKHLVITLMILTVLGSGYLLGSNMNSTESPLKSLNSNNGSSDSPITHESRNPDLNDAQGLLTTIYEDKYDLPSLLIVNIMPEPETNENSSQVKITPQEAKNIAQNFIEEPGAVAGEPKLVIMDGKATYIVPVMLNGTQVGEIYIDARTGENLGGAGGVGDNETNELNAENTSENSSSNGLESGETGNFDNGNVSEGSTGESGQTADDSNANSDFKAG